MKIVVSGKYKTINGFIDYLEAACRKDRLTVEYPDAYYYAKSSDKGTVVINVDSSYVDYSVIREQRFTGLNVCIDAANFYCHKPAGCTKLEYGSKYKAEDSCYSKSCVDEENSKSESYTAESLELTGYETLELWEKRCSIGKS